MIGQRPTGPVLALARHPVATAAEEQAPRRSHLARCVELAEDGRRTIRALCDFLDPGGDDAGERHELAG